jgi:hypothetical protein
LYRPNLPVAASVEMKYLVARYYSFIPAKPITHVLGATTERWYGEYSEYFACRLFAVCSEHVAVAPYDIAFIEAQGLNDPPAGNNLQLITFHEFEALWDIVAQPRLRVLATQHVNPLPSAQVLYVNSPFPASFKYNEPSSNLYTEWANGVARRHFEVFPDHTVVATHDPEATWPEHFEVVARAVESGTDDEGNPIDPLLRPVALSHAAFEATWEKYALERLRILAAQPHL